MKASPGFSLVECMVVLALITIIISFGIPAFSAWRSKHETEGQCRTLVRHLSFARMKAYAEKKVVGLRWDNATFSSYRVVQDGNEDKDIVDNGTDKTLLEEAVRFSWKTLLTGTSLTFDGRGFSSVDNAIFRIEGGSDASGVADCVVVTQTRIQAGCWNGSQCVPK